MGDNVWNGTPYDAGIFLDNDKKNIDIVALCGSKMATILIPCNPSAAVHINSPIIEEYVNSLSPEGKEAAKTILMMSHAIENQIERYDPTSGIKAPHVEEVKNWVLGQRLENSKKRLVALFDWDRTLTIMEGIWSFGSEGLAGIPRALLPYFKRFKNLPSAMERWDTMTPKAVTEYYCGGPERVNMLQEMFDFLYENKVDIYVLTYNPSCETNRRILEEMMNVLTRNRRVGYLCASMEKGRDKKKAIQKSGEYAAAFEAVCPPDIENQAFDDEAELERLLNELHAATFRGGSKKKKRHATRKKLNKRSTK